MEISVNAFVTLDGVMQAPGGPDEDRSGGFAGGGWLVPFPRVLNQGPKYVVSTTLSHADAAWGATTVIRDDVTARIAELKAAGEGDLQVHGSWQLVRTLHDAGLVDVFRLLQFPVVVGRGKRLFGQDAVPTGFDVEAAAALPGGVVALELRQTRFGTHAVGEYAVRDGRESVA